MDWSERSGQRQFGWKRNQDSEQGRIGDKELDTGIENNINLFKNNEKNYKGSFVNQPKQSIGETGIFEQKFSRNIDLWKNNNDNDFRIEKRNNNHRTESIGNNNNRINDVENPPHEQDVSTVNVKTQDSFEGKERKIPEKFRQITPEQYISSYKAEGWNRERGIEDTEDQQLEDKLNRNQPFNFISKNKGKRGQTSERAERLFAVQEDINYKTQFKNKATEENVWIEENDSRSHKPEEQDSLYHPNSGDVNEY